ncbi:MAG TPA: ABC transporter permease [Mucilaginibacter sp.]|nr:ABC transporter permease [Mucilaginibacter sp.]
MLKNYFNVAWRNIQRNAGFTALNLVGLAFGLAVFITALLYVDYEASFDKWDRQLSNVYRVDVSQTYTGETTERTIFSPYPLGTVLIANCPEIQAVTRVLDKGECLITAADKQLYIDKIMAADSSFFTVFPYKFVFGNGTAALKEPNCTVISLATSQKFFGDANPVGKTLRINNGKSYTITGVFRPTGPSHLDFNICVSYFSKVPNNWGAGIYFTYAILKSGTSSSALSGKAKSLMIDEVANYNYASMVSSNPRLSAPGSNKEEWLKNNSQVTINDVHFEPVSSIHLSPQASSYRDAAENHPLLNTQVGNDKPVIFFAMAAVLVLVLACINYTNLSIASAGKRAKEAGMRKVMGARRLQLVKQFLAEAVIHCFVALLVGLFFAKCIIYLINHEFGMQLTFFNRQRPMQNLILAIQLISLTLLVSIISGSYPALILSSFRPVRVLKGGVTPNAKGRLLRNALVIAQFSISSCFIIGMMVVHQQLNFMNSKDPGFSTSQVLVLKVKNERLIDRQSKEQKIGLIKRQLLQIPGVENVAMTDFYPGKPSLANQNQASFNGQTAIMTFDYVHFDYFKVLNIQMLAGRDFSTDHASDTLNSAIINQTAARYMGYTDPVGQKVTILNRDYRIIGVVKDNYVTGYNSTIAPEIYAIGAQKGLLSGYQAILVKIDGRNAAAVVSAIQKYWKTVEPDFPLRYSWLDRDFAKLLDRYERFGKITILLSVVSIIIALMGILSLSAFAAAQRTKEIGVRKVFGASVLGIATLLSADFFKLVVVSLLIAFPVAYWETHKWLQEFAYRIDPSWLTFFFAATAVLTLALITVSFQAIKAAMANPVKTLRAE